MRSQYSSGPSRSDWERFRNEGEQQFPEYGPSRPRGGYEGQDFGDRPEYQQSQSAGRQGEGWSQSGGWGGSDPQSFRGGGSRQEGQGSFQHQQGYGQSQGGGYESEEFGRGYGGGQERYYGQSNPRPASPRYEHGGRQQGYGGGQGYGQQYGQSFGQGGDYGQSGSGYGGGQQYGGQQFGGQQFGAQGGSGQYGMPGQQGSQRFGQQTQSNRNRRGPKDFVRSDERIREAVCERLSEEDSIDISEVSVNVKEGCVTLEGTVPERRMRHTIEDIADNCWGVKDVENHVRVQSQYGQSGQAGASGDLTSEASRSGSSLSAKSKGREEQKDQQSH